MIQTDIFSEHVKFEILDSKDKFLGLYYFGYMNNAVSFDLLYATLSSGGEIAPLYCVLCISFI